MPELVPPAAGHPFPAQAATAGLGAAIVRKLAGAGIILGALLAVSWLLYALAAGLGNLFGSELGEAIGNILGVMLAGVMVLATLLTMADRKWSALIQDRVGPNRARLFGINHPLWGIPHIVADVVKMLLKEDFVPGRGNKLMHALAPLIAFAASFCLFVVVPVGPEIRFFGRDVALWAAPGLDVGLLFVFAMASVAVFGTSLAGWASNNKLALLGSMRASAQLVSYEVTLGLTLVGAMIAFQTLQLDQMTTAQTTLVWGWLPAWGLFLQPLGMLAYFAAAGAEIKRPPFDMPEAESEIIGYFIEYSGLKFGLFLIAEYIEVVVFAGVLVTVFLGGWHVPWASDWLRANASPIVFGVFSASFFWLKVLFICWLSLAIRWTFPRFRYDQVMHLGWKILLPLSLVNVLVTGAAVLYDPSLELLAAIGLCEILIVAGMVGVTLGRESTAPPAQPGGGH